MPQPSQLWGSAGLWTTAAPTITTASCSNQVVWHVWNAQAQAATDTSWGQWNSQYVTTNALGAQQGQAQTANQYQQQRANALNQLQSAMNSQVNAGIEQMRGLGNVQGLQPPQRTPEEMARLETELRQSQAEHEKRRLEALDRATKLLLAHLTPRQAADFGRTRTFIIHSKDGDRVYEIGYGTAGNIRELKDGVPVAKYCIHPDDLSLPVPDVMLAQKLMLETDENTFLIIANRTRIAA